MKEALEKKQIEAVQCAWLKAALLVTSYPLLDTLERLMPHRPVAPTACPANSLAQM